MEFFQFSLGDFAVFILLGVSLLVCHMVTMSRLDALEGKVDLLVELAVGRDAARGKNRPAPARSRGNNAATHRRAE